MIQRMTFDTINSLREDDESVARKRGRGTASDTRCKMQTGIVTEAQEMMPTKEITRSVSKGSKDFKLSRHASVFVN